MSCILSKTAKLILFVCILFSGVIHNIYAQQNSCPPDGTTGSTCPWTTASFTTLYEDCYLVVDYCYRCCEGRVEYYIKRRTFRYQDCIPELSTVSDYQNLELYIQSILDWDVLTRLQNTSPPCISSMPECLDPVNCTPGTVYLTTFSAPCKVWVLATRNNENGIPTQYADLVTCEASVLCKAEYRVCNALSYYCKRFVTSYTPVIPTTCSSTIPQMPPPINGLSPFDRCFSSGCVFNQ